MAPPFVFEILQYLAWSRDAVRTLTTEQRLIASGAAFAIALLVGIAIDRIWGARFGAGVARTTWQALLPLAI